MDPLDIIASSDDAAFGTDQQQRIVLWNKAAEKLLGYPASRVLGKSCHEILCGRDVFGNRYCGERCPLINMARNREQIGHFELEVRREAGESLSASFSIVVVPGSRSGQFTVIHFLQAVDRRNEVEALVRRILAGSPAPIPPASAAGSSSPAPAVSLTARELEVLRLLADGTSTREIADSLFISVTTARNHVQNILRKLEVHSKLEAVTLAWRTNLL